MSNEANGVELAPRVNPPRSLVTTDDQQSGGKLQQIQNPHDLLGEAVRRMTAQKQAEVLGKAAEECLRLQVKGAENKIDLHILNEKLDQATRFAREATANKGADIEFSTEHRSKEGDTRITVRTKPEKVTMVQPEKPPVAQRSAQCFVATACFGDYNHPVVVELRKFRDDVLLTHSGGKRLVSAYYSVGPHAAAALNSLPGLKPATRGMLRLVVRGERLRKQLRQRALFPKKLMKLYRIPPKPQKHTATRPSLVRQVVTKSASW